MNHTTQPWLGDTRSSPIALTITGTVISLIIAAGIVLIYMPRPAPVWGPVLWLGIAAVLTAASIILISRKKPFSFKLFFKVAKWVFLYMLILSGMGEFIIILDGSRGFPLIVISLVVVMFLINVPMLWGFSVARQEKPPEKS